MTIRKSPNHQHENRDLSAYTIQVGDDSQALQDTLPAGDRVILGFGENAAEFAQLVALPAEWESAVRK